MVLIDEYDMEETFAYDVENEINVYSFSCREGGLEFFFSCRFLLWRDDDLDENVNAIAVAAVATVSTVSTRLRSLSAFKNDFNLKKMNFSSLSRSFISHSGHAD